MKATWLAAAALAGVLFGGASTQLLQRSGDTADTGQQYVLLLHEDARRMNITEEQLPAVIAEYSAWAGTLHENKQLVSAEKLRDDGGRWLGSDGILLSVDRTESVGGYFIIRADSYEQAISIARQSPHLKYGGTIEVRGIENTSTQ